MKYEEIKDHPFRIEITKEEMDNAMLMPGEYIEEDGRYYTILGMLDGYIKEVPVECSCSYVFNPEEDTLIQDKTILTFDAILKDDDII